MVVKLITEEDVADVIGAYAYVLNISTNTASTRLASDARLWDRLKTGKATITLKRAGVIFSRIRYGWPDDIPLPELLQV